MDKTSFCLRPKMIPFLARAQNWSLIKIDRYVQQSVYSKINSMNKEENSNLQIIICIAMSYGQLLYIDLMNTEELLGKNWYQYRK